MYVYSTVLYFRKYGSNDTEVLSYLRTKVQLLPKVSSYVNTQLTVRAWYPYVYVVHVQYSGSDVLSKNVLFRKYDTSQSLHRATVRKYGITVRVLPDR